MAKTQIEWIEIVSDEMMRDQMKNFLEFLNKNKVKYRSYQVDNFILMKLKVPSKNIDKWNTEMGAWVYYNPINVESPRLRKRKTLVSEYDVIEDLSNWEG